MLIVICSAVLIYVTLLGDMMGVPLLSDMMGMPLLGDMMGVSCLLHELVRP